MCGIAGILNFNKEPVSLVEIKKMTDIILHRGPDDEGAFIDGYIGLGHRRLAIIDLSRAGHQPMEGSDSVIVYNGEIYNFKLLRVELESYGYEFRSNTDTEVILHAYREWGIDCIYKFNGMFSFALWDKVNKKLFLVRDKYGIKPLYFYKDDNILVFGSEIKSIIQHPKIKVDIDYYALNEYFTFQNIFSDRTLFKGIRLLPNGCYIEISNAYFGVKRYWDYDFDTHMISEKSEEDYLYELRRLFEKAVTRQLVSDVPVGSYLSGGMDSGSITSIASRSINRLLTFTCGFDMTSVTGFEASFDERGPAEMMANAFKTEHYEMVIHAGDMPYIMPKLIYHLEDLRLGMCYPNYFISRLTSKFVKVVLGGAGGDELFAGYPWRYYMGFGTGTENDYYLRYYNYWQRLINDEEKKDFFSSRVINELQGHDTFDVFKSIFLNPKDISKSNIDNALNNSLYFEAKTFLNGLFIVEDKLSMANSLESRVPFMDDEMVEFSMRLPLKYKLGNYSKLKRIDENVLGRKEIFFSTNDGKTLLRKAMEGYMPKEILERKKQGFSAPDESWYKGESLNYVKQILLDSNTLNRGIFNQKYVEKILDEHCQGKKNHRLFIWSLLCFEWWNRIFIDNSMATYL